MPNELNRAFEYGIAIDASSIKGFGDETHSDLFLHPEAETIMQLPWRPEYGKVVRMFSSITYPDGRPFECDTRNILKKAVKKAEALGYHFSFGAEQEFYLFNLDENGKPTKEPYDEAGYMDIAPDDKGENIRREICLTLEQMGIYPESSHHEEGPGQNETDFKYSDPLTAADNATTFKAVVRTIAARHGLCADFSPKPLPGYPGSGLHINISIHTEDGKDHLSEMIAGIMEKVCDITAFLNPLENSYERFGKFKAPKYISWSAENRSQLIRIPAAPDGRRRMELRSADPAANPYLAFLLLMRAGMFGIDHELVLPPSTDINLFNASTDVLNGFRSLPASLEEARKTAAASGFVRKCLPAALTGKYCSNY
jgi:glutamine synthetase